MPRKTKSKQPKYELLSIKVSDFNAHVDAAINHNIFDRRYAHNDTPIYRFHNSVEITGECDYPEERANCIYTINITSYGASSEFNSVLKDYQERDDDYQPKYLKRKGELIPIYNPPKGIGYIEKCRGEDNWYCYVPVTPQTITDMFTLLSSNIQPLYLAINEVKEGRRRFVRGITLQMKHPAYE